ncbi:hypothetical protein FJQ54_01095 [Sandaracinobacter neustonicus]|uniref:Autotransporter outer membrane beta-barrel domain-containing protein n=1 Tax=Sandaracinobacter neustonicus TaxID=1715348 RepID=A0A501XVS7_9SPHN|nr:hypothetical protein [Sandaracinobacter neustonicus]TPE64625.1 hypothetical protein FJQ54_01095 [Sandaracinobacter neustonicus]
MKLSTLLGSPCIVTLAVAAAPALADTTISKDSTTPLDTLSAGNILIKKDAELSVATGAAITVNSSNTVTVEDDDSDDSDDEPGQITAGKADGATGVLIQPGVTTTITNGGTISVLEEFVPLDEDGNSIADGPIASAKNRYGIHVASGDSVTGSITNTGTITLEGLNSAGIAVDSTLVGSLTNSGSIRVVGDNSYGIRTSDVTGNIVLEGSIVVTGAGARAVSIEGDVGGSIRIQGTVAHQTSFVYDDDGNTIYLSRYDLRLGAPAVSVAGNVAGGIVVAVPPDDNSSTDDDEDDDGVVDSSEGSGTVIAYGNGPGMLIASDKDIVIGTLPTANGGYSLLVEGGVSGTATYSRTDAYGIVIGGAEGTVSLPGGIGVTGAVQATTQDAKATALLINEGVTVSSLYNSGTIMAAISSQGEGEAYAIQDLSGTLTKIENTGFITASGSSTDIVYALDLSRTTADVVIDQYMNAEDIETSEDIEEDLDEGETDDTVYTLSITHKWSRA